MDIRDKLKYVTGFFRGKDSNLHPSMYMPVKTLMWLAANPEEYVDQEDKSKVYTPDEVAQLDKKYFLMMLYIVKNEAEIEIKRVAVQKLEALKQLRITNYATRRQTIDSPL